MNSKRTIGTLICWAADLLFTHLTDTCTAVGFPWHVCVTERVTVPWTRCTILHVSSQIRIAALAHTYSAGPKQAARDGDACGLALALVAALIGTVVVGLS